MGYKNNLIYYELEDIVGAENVSAKINDLDVVSTDVCSISRFWIDRGQEPVKPDYLVYPNNTKHVEDIIKLAQIYKIPITARGGGAGDKCGAMPIYGGIMLNMSKMDKVIRIDEHNLTVEAEAGILQCDLEEELNKKGYTLNFFPASLYCSSLGGFIANRGSGTLSTKYGKIDNLIVSMEVVLPNGNTLRTALSPDHSSGPDLNRLFLGAEGTLGIITKATLKMYYIPEERRFNAFLFDNLEHAIDAGRRLMVNRVGASVMRVYDEKDTAIMVKRVLGVEEQGNYMIVGFDGFKELLDAQEKVAYRILKEAGGKEMGSEAGKNWWDNRFKFYYPPFNLEAEPVLHGVIDTISDFKNILNIYYEQKEEIESRFKEWDITYFGHFSHWYEYGTILYPTFIVRKIPEDVDTVLRLNYEIWKVGVRIALKYGGTVNEHHGIGLGLGNYLKEMYGDGFKMMQDIKNALDPYGIMNPGKLGFERR